MRPKRARWFYLAALLCVALFIMGADATGCGSADAEESESVNRQQALYLKNQPIPFLEWSLCRQLWVDFYKSQNEAVATYSYIQAINDGTVVFETPSIGYPTPRDTQLTNPLQYYTNGAVVEQAEPNGLFTSKNSDATVIMAANDDGTVSPIYTELKVTTFPFPVKWDPARKMFTRAKGDKPSVRLSLQKR